MRRARLQDFATKLALKGLMAFQDNDIHVTFSQQQTKQQSCWPTAYDTDAGLDARHASISCSDVVGRRAVLRILIPHCNALRSVVPAASVPRPALHVTATKSFLFQARYAIQQPRHDVAAWLPCSPLQALEVP